MKCDHCGVDKQGPLTTAGNEGRPHGWKQHAKNGIYCNECTAKHFVVRAVTLPVRGPLGASWPELREALKEAWSLTTQIKTRILDELYAKDVRRDAQEKMPKMPSVAMSQKSLSVEYPTLPTGAVGSLLEAAKVHYKQKRYKILWTHDDNQSNPRYPQPLVSRANDTRICYEPAGKSGGDLVPCVRVTIIRGKRFCLQLQGGREYRHQLAMFRMLANEDAMKMECQIYRKFVGNGKYNGVMFRSGGQRRNTRVMMKLVGWFPRQPEQARSGVLFLTSTPDAMLVALDMKDNRVFTINADHIKRRAAEHRRRLHRWSEDQKLENRPISFDARRKAACTKYNNWKHTQSHTLAKQVVEFAKRRRFAEVQWVEPDQRFTNEFCWDALFNHIDEKCDIARIVFTKGGKPHEREQE